MHPGSTDPTDRSKRRVADELAGPVREARALARKLGLDPYPVNYWIVDHDEMNALIAYDGFQTRYPHWRWGMNYERQRKSSQFLGGKAFEIVNNDDPANAFLQESNALADQKAVVTHVEAHADFFNNSEWFADDPDAAATLERHARAVESIAADPDVDRSEVEAWIDHVLCIQDNIDQYRPDPTEGGDDADADGDPLGDLELSEEVRDAVFDETWAPDGPARPATSTTPATPDPDLLRFLRDHGKQFDAEAGKAVEMADWQRTILDLLWRESQYFASQRMTKVMNEGWAAYWESLMMGEEAFAGADEFLDYADHQAQVLGSPGLNPYRLGKALWEYVENTANRRAVLERLLQVEGVTWRNFHDVVDAEAVLDALEPDPAIDRIGPDTLDRVGALDDELVDRAAVDAARNGEIDVARYPWKLLTTAGLARRHYSLVKPQFRGFLRSVDRTELERCSRYLFERDRYPTVEAALADVDYEAGWERMRTVRESHNDVTFVDEFLTQEFVDANDFFTYEYSHATGDFRATSTDYRDVKKKLLLRFTNLGKPTVVVADANHQNRNELLLGHRYNGVQIDLDRAERTLERVFELWGRPVALDTIVKTVPESERDVARRRGVEPEPEEQGVRIRHDGEETTVEDLPWAAVEHLAADDVDYDTKPAEWLA